MVSGGLVPSLTRTRGKPRGADPPARGAERSWLAAGTGPVGVAFASLAVGPEGAWPGGATELVRALQPEVRSGGDARDSGGSQQETQDTFVRITEERELTGVGAAWGSHGDVGVIWLPVSPKWRWGSGQERLGARSAQRKVEMGGGCERDWGHLPGRQREAMGDTVTLPPCSPVSCRPPLVKSGGE